MQTLQKAEDCYGFNWHSRAYDPAILRESITQKAKGERQKVEKGQKCSTGQRNSRKVEGAKQSVYWLEITNLQTNNVANKTARC